MLFNKVESRLQNRHFIKKELGQRQEQGVDVFGGVFLSSLNSLKNINQYKKECKQFCRLVINFLLDGKPLKSRELFAQLK
jgi:recombinational DNA repair protein (RecF pathway)